MTHVDESAVSGFGSDQYEYYDYEDSYEQQNNFTEEEAATKQEEIHLSDRKVSLL